ncbi:MAG TPA: hypothetical protein VK576_00675 [Thermoleophilia bacterium]|nr:hypothetical protein [Thermoleophilia bacterium]
MNGALLATSTYLIVFRIFHILAGVAWAGSVFLVVVFLQPSAAAVGPAASPVLMELLGKRRLIDRIIGLGVVTVVAGGFLYWHDWQAFGSLSDFLSSHFGLVLTIGGVCAIVALLIGIFGSRPAARRLVELGGTIAAAEGPPPPEIVAEVPVQQQRLKVLSRVSFAFLVVAVLAMSTARYW